MSNTPLTLTTAAQAGQLSAEITSLNGLIAEAQTALLQTQTDVATGIPSYLVNFSFQGRPGAFSADMTLSNSDTQTVLSWVITTLQGHLTAYTAQLGAL